MLGYLISYVINIYNLNLFEKLIVFTDSIPVQKKKKAIEKAAKKILAHKLPDHVSYHICHHSSKTNYDLQIIDYCNWAIYRKWEMNDKRSYEIIQRVIASELDIFKEDKDCFY